MLSPFYIREMKPGRGWKNGKGKRTSVEACEGGARSKEKRAEGKGREARKCKCKRRGKEIRKVWIRGVYGGKLGIRYIRDLQVRHRVGETRHARVQRGKEREENGEKGREKIEREKYIPRATFAESGRNGRRWTRFEKSSLQFFYGSKTSFVCRSREA